MFRRDFPIFEKKKGLIYFDHAATSQKPKVVIDAISRFYEEDYGTVHRAIYGLVREASENYEKVRQNVAHFLHAKTPDEIIFTKGTTAALNLVAASFGKAFVQKGDTILVTEIEHHANLVPWQMMAEERGAHLEFIPVKDSGEIDLEKLKVMIHERVKIVSLAHVSNVIGVKHPIKEICALAHEKGALVCVDGAQSAGHMKIDVQDLDCDFFVFSGHKIYGPTGIGVLYGKKELLEKMPPIEGGGDMIEHVTLEKTTFAKAPMKFEAGTPPIASVMGLKAAIDYLQNVGLEHVHDYVEEVTRYCEEALQGIPRVKLIGTPKVRGPIISFIIEGAHPLDVATLLDCKGIALRSGHHCSQPAMQRFGVTSTLRLSFGLYNTKKEVDCFVEHLKSIISLF